MNVSDDASIGAITLVGNHNWKTAPHYRRFLAYLFGHHVRYVHLHKRLHVAWWLGQPYLVSIAEADE